MRKVEKFVCICCKLQFLEKESESAKVVLASYKKGTWKQTTKLQLVHLLLCSQTNNYILYAGITLEFYKLHNFAGLDPGYRTLHKCKNVEGRPEMTGTTGEKNHLEIKK